MLSPVTYIKWEHEHKDFGATWCLQPQCGMVFGLRPETLALCLQPEAAAPEELGPCSSQGRNQT